VSPLRLERSFHEKQVRRGARSRSFSVRRPAVRTGQIRSRREARNCDDDRGDIDIGDDIDRIRAESARRESGGREADPRRGRDIRQQILALDLKGNQFTADFYGWFRWKGDAKVFDTFDLANGRITSRTGIVKKDLDGGVHYASARILATITKF
jgi:hypothetical protein